jgi:hypothetical protein
MGRICLGSVCDDREVVEFYNSYSEKAPTSEALLSSMADIQWRIPSWLMNRRRLQCEALVRLASRKSASLYSEVCNQLVVENGRQGWPEE